jgi:hypothetical protein
MNVTSVTHQEIEMMKIFFSAILVATSVTIMPQPALAQSCGELNNLISKANSSQTSRMNGACSNGSSYDEKSCSQAAAQTVCTVNILMSKAGEQGKSCMASNSSGLQQMLRSLTRHESTINRLTSKGMMKNASRLAGSSKARYCEQVGAIGYTTSSGKSADDNENDGNEGRGVRAILKVEDTKPKAWLEEMSRESLQQNNWANQLDCRKESKKGYRCLVNSRSVYNQNRPGEWPARMPNFQSFIDQADVFADNIDRNQAFAGCPSSPPGMWPAPPYRSIVNGPSVHKRQGKYSATIVIVTQVTSTCGYQKKLGSTR